MLSTCYSTLQRFGFASRLPGPHGVDNGYSAKFGAASFAGVEGAPARRRVRCSPSRRQGIDVVTSTNR